MGTYWDEFIDNYEKVYCRTISDDLAKNGLRYILEEFYHPIRGGEMSIRIKKGWNEEIFDIAKKEKKK